MLLLLLSFHSYGSVLYAQSLPFKIGQIWEGGYTCGIRNSQLYLYILDINNNTIDAVFFFFYKTVTNEINYSSGLFLMKGEYFEDTLSLTLNGDKWLKNPGGWQTINLAGTINDDRTKITGSTSCKGKFQVTLAARHEGLVAQVADSIALYLKSPEEQEKIKESERADQQYDETLRYIEKQLALYQERWVEDQKNAALLKRFPFSPSFQECIEQKKENMGKNLKSEDINQCVKDFNAHIKNASVMFKQESKLVLFDTLHIGETITDIDVRKVLEANGAVYQGEIESPCASIKNEKYDISKVKFDFLDLKYVADTPTKNLVAAISAQQSIQSAVVSSCKDGWMSNYNVASIQIFIPPPPPEFTLYSLTMKGMYHEKFHKIYGAGPFTISKDFTSRWVLDNGASMVILRDIGEGIIGYKPLSDLSIGYINIEHSKQMEELSCD